MHREGDKRTCLSGLLGRLAQLILACDEHDIIIINDYFIIAWRNGCSWVFIFKVELFEKEKKERERKGKGSPSTGLGPPTRGCHSQS